MLLQLSDNDIALVNLVAKKRVDYLTAKNLLRDFYGDRDPWFQESNSYGAEVAFCRWQGVEPDTSYNQFNRVDVVLLNGWTVDVKWTEYRTGHLLAKEKDWEHPPIWFALVIGRIPNFRYIGGMLAVELLRPERITNLNGKIEKACYAATQAELVY